MRKKISEQSGYCNGDLFFDFGKAAYCQLELELSGEFQDLVQVVISEDAKDGHVVFHPNWCTFKIDNFRVKPDQKLYRFNIPTHRGCYGAFPHVETPAEFGGEVAVFRYVEVCHYYGPVTVRRIEFYNDSPEDASCFESSDEKLNRVWDFCKYSILATSIFPCYVDGERERMPYEGDAYITELGHFCCGADYSIAANTIDHFMTHGDKTWPTEWLLVTPLLVANYVLYSGDKAPLERWLKTLDNRLLNSMCRPEDGLLVPVKPVRDIIDWPESCRDNYELGESNFVPNAYRYGALMAMSRLTGNQAYADMAIQLKAALREKMMRNGLYVDSLGSSHTALHTAMFALRFGLVEPDEIAAHQAVIRKVGMGCSVYGAQYLLEGCFEGGLDELGMQLLTADGMNSWLHMLECGSTITMESWDESQKANLDWSHPWGAAPANIIPRYVAGVQPLEPGFRRFRVKPSCAAPEHFFLRHPTSLGGIEVRYDKGQTQVSLGNSPYQLKQLTDTDWEILG